MQIQYYNLYTHYVITTAERLPLISETNRPRIEKYITGIVNNNDSKMYAIYANPDHLHFLASRSPRISDEVLATIVAESSVSFINKNHLVHGKFGWQDSCAAFSVSKKDVDLVCKYILNQPEHHKKMTFAQEYDEMLRFYERGLRWPRL